MRILFAFFVFLLLLSSCVCALELQAMVLILSVCNYGAAVSPQALRPIVFGTQGSVDHMLRSCSYNASALSKRATIVQQVIPIPCYGQNSNGETFDSRMCPFEAWGDYAMDYAQNVLRLPIQEYTHRVMIVPRGNVCSWGGMGYVGCKKDCRVWISGDLWDMPVAYFHELGHNMGLGHAGVLGKDGYEDFSSAMGFCCNTRCHGAPHASALGWSQPIAALDQRALHAGKWISFNVPTSTKAKKNHIVIRPDWNKNIKETLYISYRKREGYDIGLRPGFGDVVILHSMLPNHNASSFETSLQANQMVEEARLGTGVVVYVSKISDGLAKVAVCRRTASARCML
jgi:hypothetical protein